MNVVHTVLVDPAFRSNEVTIKNVAIPARVIGTPRDGASQEESLAALTLPNRLGARPARAETSDDFRDMRLVFAYAPLSINRICDADAGSSSGVGGKAGVTEVSAALCRGDKQLSYGILRTQATGPTDPGFRKAVLQLLGQIMPPQTDQMIRRQEWGGP
jgi:hypothetical protein